MSRRCLICADINPCSKHSSEDQESELAANDAAIAAIRRQCNRDLSFDTLRKANMARLPQFKNKLGVLAHSKSDGSDWTPAQWLQAVIGELGEYANLRKKFERGDIDEYSFIIDAQKELADVIVYLDILAFQLGINLGLATIDKFNEVSRRVKSSVFIIDNAVERCD